MTPIESVIAEAARAKVKYGDFTSAHEAMGVLVEEVNELHRAVHENSILSVTHESLQVAAVAFRLYETCNRALSEQPDAGASAFRERSNL